MILLSQEMFFKKVYDAFFFLQIISLVSKLSVGWPSLFIDNQMMWERQWNKQGSCSTCNEYHYFKLGINIWEEYNITVILENDGIIPGASYNRERIRDAILT
jgi:ribonuclease I